MIYKLIISMTYNHWIERKGTMTMNVDPDRPRVPFEKSHSFETIDMEITKQC